MLKQECKACGIVVTGFPRFCPNCGRDAGFRLLDAMAKDDRVIPIRIVMGLNSARAASQSLDLVAGQSSKHAASLRFMANLMESMIDQVYKEQVISVILELELTDKRLALLMEAMAANARHIHQGNGYITLLSELNDAYRLAHARV